MNEKPYRSSPAAGKLLRPSRAQLHRLKLGFKKGAQKASPGHFIAKVLSGELFYKFHRV